MIVKDHELSVALLALPGEGADPRWRDLSRFARATGMVGLRLPDGGVAVGWDVGDATWGVLLPEGDLGVGSAPSTWIGGRIGSAGCGFKGREPASMPEAFAMALRMPSPMSRDGNCLEGRVDSPDEAREIREGADELPSPGM